MTSGGAFNPPPPSQITLRPCAVCHDSVSKRRILRKLAQQSCSSSRRLVAAEGDPLVEVES